MLNCRYNSRRGRAIRRRWPSADVPFTDVPFTDVPLTDVPFTDVPFADVPFTDVPFADVPFTDVPLPSWLPFHQAVKLFQASRAYKPADLEM